MRGLNSNSQSRETLATVFADNSDNGGSGLYQRLHPIDCGEPGNYSSQASCATFCCTRFKQCLSQRQCDISTIESGPKLSPRIGVPEAVRQRAKGDRQGGSPSHKPRGIRWLMSPIGCLSCGGSIRP